MSARIQILLIVLFVGGVIGIASYWISSTTVPPTNTNREKEIASGDDEASKRERSPQGENDPGEQPAGKLPISHPKGPSNGLRGMASAQQAIETAKLLIGLEGEYNAERVTVKRCIVPFVRKEVAGKSAWKVTIKDVRLKFKRGEEEEECENQYVRELECIILAETGQLLQIESKIPKGMTIKSDRIPVEQAERRYGSEKIKGLPSGSPQLSLNQVLQRAFEERGHWASTAKQIVAFYVLNSRGEHEEIRPAQPLWLIHVRGFFPPMPLPSGGAPRPGQEARDPGSIDYMRMLFADDGTALGGGNMHAPK